MTSAATERRLQGGPPEHTAQPRPAAGRFCVLVTSSDRARDVFEIVFQNAELMWGKCDWQRFVGFTSEHKDLYGFKSLSAKPSDWRQQVCDYLDSLPAHIEYVLRIDEDALFMSPVDGGALDAVADLMVKNDLSYVSLLPVRRNLVGGVIEALRRKFDTRPLRPLSFSEPYYSSVAAAIWKRSYLRTLLKQPGSIWEFEHTVTGERHYAVWKPLLDQDQIVVKGRWSARAKRLLAQQGISLPNSKREFQTIGSRLRDVRENITFQIIGYWGLRMRKRFNVSLWRP
jgi:hypothetical protein